MGKDRGWDLKMREGKIGQLNELGIRCEAILRLCDPQA
jgi:hypothetical protein